MDKKELKFILQEGEGLKSEFKEKSDAKGIAKEMAAFANSSGGRIFLGVDDMGDIKGIDSSNRIRSEIQNIARNCDPAVKIHIEKADCVLIINVSEGENKPYSCSQGFYIREGPNSQKLSRDEIINFANSLGKIRFDEQVNEEFDYREDFDKNKFSNFLHRSKVSYKDDIKNILINLSIAKQAGKKLKISNAGILLFAKEPSKFIRQNFITCVLYKGKERVNVIDRKDFKDDILSNYEHALNFLKQHLRLEYEIKDAGARREIPEIPYGALREALINAIIHRDYFEKGTGIFVEIFDDRVEIYNFGKLLFDRRKLGKVSMSRNPILFDMFYRLGLIEKIGSGINRIKSLIKERNLKIRFEADEFFRVVYIRPRLGGLPRKLPRKLPRRLLNQLKRILRLQEKNFQLRLV